MQMIIDTSAIEQTYGFTLFLRCWYESYRYTRGFEAIGDLIYGTPGMSYVNLLYFMQCSSHYMQCFFLLDAVLLSLYVLFMML